MLTTIGLCLLNLGYLAYLAYDIGVQSRRGGETLTAVRLRRRAADAVFLAVIIAAGLYYEISHDRTPANLAALALLLALVLTAMRLSEDGVLVLTLTGGQNLILPVARIDDLEQAAAFFTGEEALQHLINSRKENQP